MPGPICKRREAIILEKEQFSIRRPGMIGEEKFRKYAVLIPLIRISGVTYLLFEKKGPMS